MRISIVITTFQRRERVPTAIRSALAFLSHLDGDGEVVVVDDASTDGTMDMLETAFSKELAADRMRLVSNPSNQGVSEAKNIGILASRGVWVLLLDSDDELISETAPDALHVLETAGDAPIVFFRCVNEMGAFIGHKFDEAQILDLRRYLMDCSYGEALVAINRSVSSGRPFDADLRGYEGLGCARLIRSHGPAVLSTLVLRRYNRSYPDRLSRPRQFLARLALLGRGHLRFMATFRDVLPVSRRSNLWLKGWVYRIVGTIYSVWSSLT